METPMESVEVEEDKFFDAVDEELPQPTEEVMENVQNIVNMLGESEPSNEDPASSFEAKLNEGDQETFEVHEEVQTKTLTENPFKNNLFNSETLPET
jgi:dsDNA-specific endonuclease/ATPase MutS2